MWILGAGPQVGKKTHVDRPKGGPPTLFGQSGVSVPTTTESPNSITAPAPRQKQGRIWRVSPDKHAGQRANCKIKRKTNKQKQTHTKSTKINKTSLTLFY